MREGISDIGRHSTWCSEKAFESWQRWVWVPALSITDSGMLIRLLELFESYSLLCKMGIIMLISQVCYGVMSVNPKHTGRRVSGSGYYWDFLS